MLLVPRRTRIVPITITVLNPPILPMDDEFHLILASQIAPRRLGIDFALVHGTGPLGAFALDGPAFGVGYDVNVFLRYGPLSC